jgi:hypothetical protein
MGPYCKFCGNRCFVYLPVGLPEEVYQAYGNTTIIATCPSGQEFEKEKVGYCYSFLGTERLDTEANEHVQR